MKIELSPLYVNGNKGSAIHIRECDYQELVQFFNQKHNKYLKAFYVEVDVADQEMKKFVKKTLFLFTTDFM